MNVFVQKHLNIQIFVPHRYGVRKVSEAVKKESDGDRKELDEVTKVSNYDLKVSDGFRCCQEGVS